MRTLVFIVIGVALAVGRAAAQQAPTSDATATNAVSDLTHAVPEKAWNFSVSALTYIVPESREFVQPTFIADHGWLHLEARYNYEGLDTGSAWIGYNFSFGDKLTLDLTPMVGGVLGDTRGVAPGYKFALGWWKLELSSEGEFLINTDRTEDSFFYTWSELALSPVDWFRVGLAVQRTKLYQSEFEIQRGFLVGFSYKSVDFTTYLFDPDASRPTIVLGLGFSF